MHFFVLLDGWKWSLINNLTHLLKATPRRQTQQVFLNCAVSLVKSRHVDLLASGVFAHPHQGGCIFTFDQRHGFEQIHSDSSRIAKKYSNFQILLRKITWIVSLMLCMLLLPLQVSGWCCLKVKVHCRVLYEMFTFTIWGLCLCALRWLSLLVIAALLGGEPLPSGCNTAGSCVLMQEQGPSNRSAAKICDNVIG